MDERRGVPPIVEVGEQRPQREVERRVRELLAAGEVVALPTETVYGLAARADDARAVRRLRELKGRPETPLTWHVHDRGAVERFASLLPLARRLAARYWPGPLTLVLSGVPAGLELVADEGWTGVRVPAHPATLGVLEGLDFPVAMSSANRHGEPPLARAGEVAELFGASLSLVVDGGPSRLGEASGVLRVGPGRFELLREGLLGVDELRRTAGLSIAFVCTGNTCRSPIAEALARAGLRERLGLAAAPGQTRAPRRLDVEHFGFELASMGVMAHAGAGASPLAVELLAERGLDLRAHRARVATPEALARHDRIYALTHDHREALLALLPPARQKDVELLDPRGRDIADPIHGGLAEYRRTVAEVEEALRPRLETWA